MRRRQVPRARGLAASNCERVRSAQAPPSRIISPFQRRTTTARVALRSRRAALARRRRRDSAREEASSSRRRSRRRSARRRSSSRRRSRRQSSRPQICDEHPPRRLLPEDLGGVQGAHARPRRQRSPIGCIFFALLLFAAEFSSYRAIETTDRLAVDTSTPSDGKLDINLDIYFPSLPCAELVTGRRRRVGVAAARGDGHAAQAARRPAQRRADRHPAARPLGAGGGAGVRPAQDRRADGGGARASSPTRCRTSTTRRRRTPSSRRRGARRTAPSWRSTRR